MLDKRTEKVLFSIVYYSRLWYNIIKEVDDYVWIEVSYERLS